jgi:acyl-CoA reductase-like NAD-dependent aldehyde dehydrogenase
MNTSSQSTVVTLAHPEELFIGGKWVPPVKQGRIPVVSPHNETVCITVAEATEADMDAAVLAARAAFDRGPWPRLSHLERATFLRRLSAALELRLPELARAWVEQTGALASVAPFVIAGGKHWFDFYADLADKFDWQETRALGDGPGYGLVVREPVGVYVAIAPWNNPFGIMTGKIAPALLAGCTVIMKPAPETPIEAHIIAEAAEEVGFPDGVINLVPAHRDASDHLVCNTGVDKVSFTGSVLAGARIASVCGSRIARCTLELGGKSAAVILDDYDMEAAAKTLAQTITMSAGQVCATLSRAIVPKWRHDDFIEALAAAMRSIRVGDPHDPETQMGPLAMERQRTRVQHYVQAGRSEGAQLVAGGGSPAHLERGFYVEPTLFARVTCDMKIAREEIFGPVLSVLPYESEEEALRIANDSAFGLYGAVFTHDKTSAYRIARGVRAGTLSQNVFRFDSALPFGGFKQSGLGREGGKEGLASCTELKAIMLT